MTFVLYLVGLLVIGAVALLVALPLLKPNVSRVEEADEVEPEIARWEKQKTDAYAAIKEAEFDWQMSKLTDDDYQALRQKYEQRALAALAELDRLGKRESLKPSATT